jgi:hypothetical protein
VGEATQEFATINPDKERFNETNDYKIAFIVN